MIEKEQHLASLLSNKDQEIASLHHLVSQLQQSHQQSQQEIELSIKQAVIRREEELRVLVYKKEKEVGLAMAKREEEIMEAVRNREQQLSDAWARREAELKNEVEESLRSIDERIQWVVKRENDLVEEESRLNGLQEELEERMRKIDEVMKGSFLFLCELFPLLTPHRPKRQESSGRSQESPRTIKSFDTGDASSRTSYICITTNAEASFYHQNTFSRNTC